jgi:hypothetical protein
MTIPTFRSDGSPLSDYGFEYARSLLDVDAATVWAIVHVETRGFGFLPSRRPVILYERHIFHRLTGGRFDRDHPDLSDPAPGGYLGGAAEYSRLNAASVLDVDAALQSTSWGIGQVMGFNYEGIGYANVQAMVAEMVDCEDDQLWAMTGFIDDYAMYDELRDHNWRDFALHYNGSGAARAGREGYADKLAAAYARFQQQLPDLDVRFGQVSLFYLGFNPGPIDGILGPRTRAALIAYQKKRGIPVTGRLDDRMQEYLCMEAFAA